MAISVQSLGTAATAVQGIVVTAATNATPIVITIPAGHNLSTGDRMAIAGVTGNTGANGEWTLGAVTATTATLVGSVGNGAFGGTVRTAMIMDKTPFMDDHDVVLKFGGNFLGVVDVEAYASYADFAAGANTGGAVAPALTPSAGTNTNGSAVLPAKTTITMAATNDGAFIAMRLPRYMRTVITTFTSGTLNTFLAA